MSRPTSRALPRVAAVATLTLLLATTACSDVDGPGTTSTLPIDASTIESRSALVAAVTQQPILQQVANGAPLAQLSANPTHVDLGIGGDSLRVAAGLHAARELVPLMLRTPDASTPLRLRGMLRGALSADAPVPRAEFVPGEPVVPQSLRGLTFVSMLGEGWIVDRSSNGAPRPGAPANGVRFVLEYVDQYGEPTGARLGFLEVTDNSANGTTRYTVRVVNDAGLVVLQSGTTLGGTMYQPAIAQSGWVTDGTRRIEQSFSWTSRGMTYSYDAPFAGLHYAMGVSGDPMSGTTRLVVDVAVDGTRVRIALSATESTATAVVTVNGAVWARQVSTYDAEGEIVEGEWMQADGRTPLSVEQRARLEALGGAMDQFSALDQVDTTASDWVAEAGF